MYIIKDSYWPTRISCIMGFVASAHDASLNRSFRIPVKGGALLRNGLGWVKAELIFSKERPRARREQYCWWKKSCTTWDFWNHVNNWISHLSTGAGFQPSTVCCFQSYLIPWRWIPKLLGDDPSPRFLISQVAIHWLWVDQTCQNFM